MTIHPERQQQQEEEEEKEGKQALIRYFNCLLKVETLGIVLIILSNRPHLNLSLQSAVMDK